MTDVRSEPRSMAAEPVRTILAALALVGLDSDGLCREAGLSEALLQRPGARVLRRRVKRLFDLAEATSGDPLLGLHLAERSGGGGLLYYLGRSQRSVGDVLATLARHAGRLWGTDAHLEVASPQSWLRLEWADANRHGLEYRIARLARTLSEITSPSVRCTEVWLPYPPSGDRNEYQRILGCPVHFRRSDARLVMSRQDLLRPTLTANAQVAQSLEGAVLRNLTGATSRDVREDVTDLLETLLIEGEAPSIERVSQGLAMTSRTLQRRLTQQGCTFKELLDAVRCKVSVELLEDDGLSVGEVAARVGFAEAASFDKAFRRWTRLSPSAYRAGIKQR